MGASSGRDVSLARLVRLRPSEATDLTSKLPRRIEWRDPRGASFGWGKDAIKSPCPPGTSKLNTKCVGVLAKYNFNLYLFLEEGMRKVWVVYLPSNASNRYDANVHGNAVVSFPLHSQNPIKFPDVFPLGIDRGHVWHKHFRERPAYDLVLEYTRQVNKIQFPV